jgi:Repeat of unknown function (DUF5648)
MGEVEFVVPPAPNLSKVKAPKEPSKFFLWLKSHKALTGASFAMAVIIILVAVVLFTGQKVSVLGYQLNPLYQQASEIQTETPIAPLTISGTFANGVLGAQYSQAFTVKEKSVGVCTWSLGTIEPKITGASIVASKGAGTTGTFKATPAAAGTYQIVIKVVCGTGRGSVQLPWVVTTGAATGTNAPALSAANTCLSPAALKQLKAVYRFWNEADGDHLYTTNQTEKLTGFVSEGVVGYVFKTQVSGSRPIFRSYKSDVKAHYYSTTDDASNYGYKNESILGFGFIEEAAGSSPWYRLHKGAPLDDYFETTSPAEKAELITKGYADEGVVANICAKNT